MKIGVIIPCYNSEKILSVTVQDLIDYLNSNNFSYEIVLVNDGSKDNSFQEIKHICEIDENLTGLDLSKNFGQATARLAGINYLSNDCDAVLFMDDDGQHDVQYISEMIKSLEKFDVVYARFHDKKHSLFKRIASSLYGKIMHFMIGKPEELKLSSFFMVNNVILKTLKEYKSPYPSMLGYLLQITNKITNIDVKHKDRLEGESGYSLKKLMKISSIYILNFNMTPLRIASFLGSLFSLLGFAWGLFLIFNKFINNVLPGYTSILAVTLIIGGIIMIMLGIIGEYIGRIYMILNDKPQYNIRQVIKKNDN